MNSAYHITLTEWMNKLAGMKNTIFLGQQTAAENFYGTLKDVAMSKRYEMPVAEELQLGISIGLSIQGFLPISIYQRMDFLPRACDQLVNHLDLIHTISRDVFRPKVIIRTTIGSIKPLDVGLQHNKDLTEGFKRLLKHISIFTVNNVEEINYAYDYALRSQDSTIIIEKQDLYND